MPAGTCPYCKQSYSAVAGHCTGGPFSGCCSSFASTGGFERHLVRDMGERTRRCLTRIERLDLGWTQDRRGYWVVPQRMELERAFPPPLHSDEGDDL